jgi:serine kinase of HPr protein (carbohydrate metabolism regulator)
LVRDLAQYEREEIFLNVSDVVQSLGLEVLAGEAYLDREVSGGYAADLLSCVMAGAQANNLWLTLQTHANIVAVASLLGISAVIITEGAPVPPETLEKAEQQEMVMLSSPDPTYQTIARLVDLGI